jgi:hypothetical protein
MFGYTSATWIKQMAEFIGNDRTMDLMAGNGYITGGIRSLNPAARIVGIDNFDWQGQGITPNPITEIVKADALESVRSFSDNLDIILLSWAPDAQDTDFQVLQYLRSSGWIDKGGEFIVIGEKYGATNSNQFWQNAVLEPINELNYNHTSFDIIDEQVYLVK